MTRRWFFRVTALLGVAVSAPRAMAAASPAIGDVVPPIEAEWRRLPIGTLLVNDGPGWGPDRWILVHRPRLGGEQIGSRRLPWGGAHGAASPWRPIESAHGERWRIVAFGVADDDMAVRDAAEVDWTDDEREWADGVWLRKYEPRRPPLTAAEHAELMERTREVLARILDRFAKP